MTKKIKVISYNICALPWWGNIFGDPVNRISYITDFLIQKNPDIICLQEVFDSGIFFILNTKLANYNYVCYRPKKLNNYLSSGLAIFSKTNITECSYEKFKNTCGEDKYCDKGFATITTKVEGIYFKIVNTHLNADAIFSTYEKCEETRLRQMSQLLSKISNRNRHDIILCGDFNIDFTSVTGKKIYKKIKSLSTSCTNSKKMITFDDENIQYDQIFYIPKYRSCYRCNYKVFDEKYKKLSDHYPIQLTLTRHEKG